MIGVLDAGKGRYRNMNNLGKRIFNVIDSARQRCQWFENATS